MKTPTPTSSATFIRRKTTILAQLSVPDSEYTDASPKGSVDGGIRTLIDEINNRDGLVTTSSCAGRVSVYLEGQKKGSKDDVSREGAIQGSAVGGKGGGEWLFVSHEPVEEGEGERGYEGPFGLGSRGEGSKLGNGMGEGRLIHFKFEPMILHVLTTSPQHAQLVIQAGIEAGFRETGAVSLIGRKAEEDAMPIVAVRSMGLSFESLIGLERDVEGASQQRIPLVTSEYLRMLVKISNGRFAENQKRIARFQTALRTAFSPKENPAEWEDAEARRGRKREEGLKRREALKKEALQAEEHVDLGVILQQPDVL
ncbi:methyltransferase TYW3-domain-containing protein [Immersiella caudata]|uniref:tRNA(Phe) 7-[(3-amino-3-carboxypropyl)-4-demethylwyosine(37)-N(4)]-methyltransferase n=1 Tax=Immersiella caudata TaxID=314043 RepID=A0AA39XI88_9PEZI|nr:methyltransferase TYW3-domain-containing protein [Immersiella caudata]